MARFASAMILDGAPPSDLTKAGLSAEALSPERLASGAEST
jgi:hypothetical protein